MPALIGFKPSKDDDDILARVDQVTKAGITQSDYLRKLIRDDIRRSNGGGDQSDNEPDNPVSSGKVVIDAKLFTRLCAALEALEKKIAPYPDISQPSLNEVEPVSNEPVYKANRPSKNHRVEPEPETNPEPQADSPEQIEQAAHNFLSMFG